MRGLQEMVRRRGGFEQAGFPTDLKRIISWYGIFISPRGVFLPSCVWKERSLVSGLASCMPHMRYMVTNSKLWNSSSKSTLTDLT